MINGLVLCKQGMQSIETAVSMGATHKGMIRIITDTLYLSSIRVNMNVLIGLYFSVVVS